MILVTDEIKEHGLGMLWEANNRSGCENERWQIAEEKSFIRYD